MIAHLLCSSGARHWIGTVCHSRPHLRATLTINQPLWPLTKKRTRIRICIGTGLFFWWYSNRPTPPQPGAQLAEPWRESGVRACRWPSDGSVETSCDELEGVKARYFPSTCVLRGSRCFSSEVKSVPSCSPSTGYRQPCQVASDFSLLVPHEFALLQSSSYTTHRCCASAIIHRAVRVCA